MEYVVNQLASLGVDIQMGYDYTGSHDRYISALQRYYKSFEKNKIRIKEYIDNNDIENLTITVHALKSNSRMIGATGLSSMFELLENASRNNDMDTCLANIDKTMEAYSKLAEVLKPLGEAKSYKAKGEIDAKEAKRLADRLLTALDDYDDDLAMKLAGRLTGYPFRITQKAKLEEAMDNIRDFMYDEAAGLIREIYPSIE